MSINYNLGLNSNISQMPVNFSSKRAYAYPAEDSILYNPKEDKNPKNKKQNTIKLIFTSLLALTGIALALKDGNLGKVVNSTKKIVNKFDNKIFNLSCENAHANNVQIFLDKTLMGINKFLEKTMCINNAASIKDSFLLKHLFSTKDGKMRKLPQKITKWFTDVTVNVTKGKWQKTSSSAMEFNNQLLKLCPELKGKASQFESMVNKASSGFAQTRLNEQKKIIDPAFDHVYETFFNGIKNNPTQIIKEGRKGFVAEKFLTDGKKAYTDKLLGKIKLISNSIRDNSKLINRNINDIEKLVDPSNIQARKALREVKTSLETYSRSGGGNVAESAANLEKSLKKLFTELKTAKNSDLEKISTLMKESVGVMKNDQKGLLQEMLVYARDKYGVNSAEYKLLESHSKKFVKNLNASVTSESCDLFDHLRDLRLGSAPTEMLSHAVTLGSLGLVLSTQKDKDKRKASVIREAIPLTGGIAAAFILTLKQVGAAKALPIALGTGLILKIFGEKTAEGYLESKGKLPKNNKDEDQV